MRKDAKKLAIVVVVIMVALSACKKKYCWECVSTASNSANKITSEYCDMTEEDIKSKIGSTTAIDSTGSKPISVTYTTTCQKKK